MNANLSIPFHLAVVKLEGTQLTPKEIRTLRLLAHGYTLSEAAKHEGVSRETVKAQVYSARARLNAKNVTHAVAIAISLDMI